MHGLHRAALDPVVNRPTAQPLIAAHLWVLWFATHGTLSAAGHDQARTVTCHAFTTLSPVAATDLR